MVQHWQTGERFSKKMLLIPLLTLSCLSNGDEFFVERRATDNWKPSPDFIWKDFINREKWFMYKDGSAIAPEDRYLAGKYHATYDYVEYGTLRQILNKRYKRWVPIERPNLVRREYVYSAVNDELNCEFWFSVHAFVDVGEDAHPSKFVIYKDGKHFQNCDTKDAALKAMGIQSSGWTHQYVRTAYLVKTKPDISDDVFL